MVDTNKVEVLLTAKDQASSKINKNTKALKGMDGASKNLSKSLGTLKGVAVTAFAGWGVAKIGTDIIKTGANFKYTMAIVRGVSQATAKEYKDLEAMARKMGETTEWSASQAAEALKFLSMAGFKVKQSLAALPGTLNLATAGNLDLGRTADIVTNALTAMRLPVEELNRVSDVFIQTITSSNTNMEMMAESFKYAAPVASAFGIKIERLSALIGLLGNAGIQGSMAGTQLSMAMIKSLKVFDKYNVSTKRADGSTKDFVDALELLERRGGDAGEVLDVFSFRAGRASLALLGKGVPAIKAYIREIEKAEGATKKLVDIIRETTKIDWAILVSALKSISIDIFRNYEKSIKSALQSATEWMRLHREEVINLAGALGGVINKIKILLPHFDKAWSMITYNPAILEYGMFGLLIAGKKGAAIGMALGHMITWVDNLSKALGLASIGILKFSDIANANFKELQKLIETFDSPTILKHLNIQVSQLEQQIVDLKKATEGKVFIFKGDKEELEDKQRQLREIQDRIILIKKESFIKGLISFRMPKPPEAPKPEKPVLPDPKIQAAWIKSIQEQENFAIKMSESAVKRIKDREQLEKETLEKFRQAKMTETELALDTLDKQFLAYDNFVKDKDSLDTWYVKSHKEIMESENKSMAESMKEAMQGWASSFSSTLNEMLWGSNFTFRSIAESFGKMITQMTIQQSIIEPMFGAGGGSGLIKTALGAAGTWLTGLGATTATVPISTSVPTRFAANTATVPISTSVPTRFAAKGGIFPGGISAYSNQIVDTPTQFAFANGAGIMGEDGAEGILPLTRTPGGDLGVKTKGEGGGVTILINAIDSKSFAEVVKRNPQSIITVIGEALEGRTGLLDKIRETI